MTASLALSLLLLGHHPAGPAIRWEHRFDEALKKAKAARKPIMVDFWAEWCAWCHRLDQTTYVDPVVVKMSEDFVAVKVNTEGGRKEIEIALRYSVSALPTIVFLSPEGRQVLRLGQFQGPGQFPRTLEQARQAAAKVMALEAALKEDPKDAAALFQLGMHMFEQESYEESRELLYRAAAADARRPIPDRKQARMLIGIIQKYDQKYPEAETVLKEALAFQPPTEYDPKMLFILGRVYSSWGKRNEARHVLKQVLTNYPDSSVAKKARDLLHDLEK